MNRNTFYATTFVDEMARAGLHHVCAAPGSRHTPLMLAFAKDERIKVWPHLDERSASFFALGLVRALDEPVALICTSGTAGANMYPAIIEAHQSRIPLLVITADRPPELRHSGANQTIDQIKMFGDFVLWFVDAALPESNPPAVAIRNLRTLADRALAKANGLRKGVVHINMPFRKPLEPIEDEGDIVEAGLYVGRPLKIKNDDPLLPNIDNGFFNRVLDECKSGLIICGPDVQQTKTGAKGYESQAIRKLSRWLGFPIVADSLSGLRFSSAVSDEETSLHNVVCLGGYETYLSKFVRIEPQIIIRFGNLPISKSMNSYIESTKPEHYWHINPDGEWVDDTHTVTLLFPSDVHYFCSEILYTQRQKEPNPTSALSTQYSALEAATWDTIDHEMANGAYFDGGVVYDVVDLIPDGSTLFAGNSLPVRHLDQFGKPQNKRIYTYANRGASGIDGNISTALGAGAARPEAPLVAILGDITFYHDMNGLLAVHRCGVPVTIVLLNNDGGGIFQRLPINQFDPEFSEWFVTPHGLDYSHAARMYGLEWVSVQGREAFRQAFSESVNGRTSTIIEFRSDAKQDLARRNEIVAAVHARLRELDL